MTNHYRRSQYIVPQSNLQVLSRSPRQPNRSPSVPPWRTLNSWPAGPSYCRSRLIWHDAPRREPENFGLTLRNH